MSRQGEIAEIPRASSPRPIARATTAHRHRVDSTRSERSFERIAHPRLTPSGCHTARMRGWALSGSASSPAASVKRKSFGQVQGRARALLAADQGENDPAAVEIGHGTPRRSCRSESGRLEDVARERHRRRRISWNVFASPRLKAPSAAAPPGAMASKCRAARRIAARVARDSAPRS